MRFLSHRFVALLGLCLFNAAHAAPWTAGLANGQVLNIVEGATATGSGYFLERRFAAGQRDPQFGSGGRTFFTMGNNNNPPATLQVDPAGRVLVSGTAMTGDGRSVAVILRFLPDGQFDPAWGQQGRSLVEVARGDAIAADTLPLADGQTLVVGTIEDEQNEYAAIWRFTEAGRLDTAFGSAGLMLAAALPQSQGLSIQSSDDGSLQIALQVGRNDKVWLEVHRWQAGAAGPVRVARQEFPEEWVGPALLTRRGAGWVWADAAQPQTAPLELVAAAPASLWTVATLAAPAPRGDATPPAGHAAVNPFNEAGAAISPAAAITLDDLAWPGLPLAALTLLAGVLWWWWRRG
ncbi:MAG: hypothetical protein WA210_19400 [Burkholderiaceae bacterium]